MSADNLISVYETNLGDYWVSMEFASEFWEIEYSHWTLEEKADEARRKGEYVREGYGLYRTYDDAMIGAYAQLRKEDVVEYGVEVYCKPDRIMAAGGLLAYARDPHPLAPDVNMPQINRMIERLALSRRAKYVGVLDDASTADRSS